MKQALFAIVMLFGFSSAGFAQDLPAHCGPAGQLSDDYSGNVASDSRCFELRMYTAEAAVNGKGGIDDLHQRFREKEVALFEKHGAEIIAVWQRLDNPNTLVWMLAYRNRAHRQEVWQGFLGDPAWTALLAKYNVPITAEVFMLSASDYSAMQ